MGVDFAAFHQTRCRPGICSQEVEEKEVKKDIAIRGLNSALARSTGMALPEHVKPKEPSIVDQIEMPSTATSTGSAIPV